MNVRFALALAPVLAACSGKPDFCERYDTAVKWSAVDPVSYQARAISGAITLADGRAFRDDREPQVIGFDRGSIKYITMTASAGGGGVATLRLRAPEDAGSFALESHEASLSYCEVDGATLSTFNGQVGGCTLRDAHSAMKTVSLRGTLDVAPKPDVERDDVLDYAYAFKLTGKGDDGSSVALEVVAFASYHVPEGKTCGEGK